MDSVTQFFGIIIILFTLFISVYMIQYLRWRKQPLTLRPIAAYDAVPTLAGASIEANRPVHLSFGSAGPGGPSTLLALAGAEYFYQLTKQAAIGPISPVVTLSNPAALPLAQDTLRRAYESRHLVDRFRARNAQWYPGGTRSLAYAAAVTGLMATMKTSSHILAGSYGPELALIIDAAGRRRQPVTAVSDQLEGQAIAYALADYPLIGEEVFMVGSYLDGSSGRMGETITLDVLRWMVIVAALVIFIVTAARGIGG